jgi:RimJ/RimL family protein N-acetyltransferase
MELKVNYVITTWSGNRRSPNLKYLKDHLLNLLSLKHNLSQITIVKPIVDGCDMSYYDIDSIVDKFNCDVKILEKYDNNGQSYGQFFYAYEKYKNEFDYYIFVEDDYMVDIDFFDEILVNEYKDQNVNGFLCSYSGVHPNFPKGACSVSNGLISSIFLSKVYDFYPNPINTINNKFGWVCHVNFAEMMKGCDFEFKDFAHKYRVPYFGNKVIEYGRTDTDESIFIPHQIFNLRLKIDKMLITDIPNFLDIRNQSKEFLHNNSTFTLDQAIDWFKKNDPKFYTIKLGDVMIGYFRTSNWGNNDPYIGCDIHPDFRGLGLGYLSYLKFIDKMYNEFNVNSIKLEVISTNVRAKNLYHKLGFVKIGISEDKVIRDGVEIDSIIMELKK